MASATIKMTVPAKYDTTGIEHFHIADFRFASGAVHSIDVAYREFGRGGARTVLLPTCYGGRINETQAYRDGALADRHVVVVAMLGFGESSSPSNSPGFPAALDYRDCVRAQHALLTQKLGVAHLEAVIGFSMGGQQAYYWATMYPDFVTSAVAICGSAQTSAHNQMYLAGPAAALRSSVDFPDHLAHGTVPHQGLMAMRAAFGPWVFSPAWFRAGHWKETAPTIKEYLAKESADDDWLAFGASDLLIALEMWFNGDIAGFREDRDFQKALADITVPVLVMPCRTDQYFRWEESEIEVRHLRAPSRLEVIESIWGHAAGGGDHAEDRAWMDARIAAWLKERAGDH